jgi:hypothetical protein
MKRIALLTAALALAGPATAEAQTLIYGRAKAAVQRKADALAGRPTTVNALLRQVFDDEDAAQARYEYLGALGKSSGLFAEYVYLDGLTLLRVSSDLTPDQAAEYEEALKR